MRVAVTGANGGLGKAVVARLKQEQIDLVAVDRRLTETDHDQVMEADLRDAGEAYAALDGVDAVIHLGAIPAPIGRAPHVVYANNMLSTFNVFEVAASRGIKRVVYASSVSALGFPWQHRWSEPLYAPIDEEHPLLPQDAYGLSKAQGEEIAAAYCRRGAGSAASLRFPYIAHEDALQPLVDNVRADPGQSAHLLWAYVDRRDAAEACLLALTASFDGHQALYISAGDTSSETPTDELMARYFPNVPLREGRRGAHWPVVDVARAAAVIGFRARHDWRTTLGQTATSGQAG